MYFQLIASLSRLTSLARRFPICRDHSSRKATRSHCRHKTLAPVEAQRVEETAEFHHQLGVAYHLRRCLDDASREYTRALELDPPRDLTENDGNSRVGLRRVFTLRPQSFSRSKILPSSFIQQSA